MKLQSVVTTHKIIGMVVTVFVVVLSVTGIVLMHTDDLSLSESYVKNQVLLTLYNISPDSDPISYEVNGKFLTQIDDRLYFNVSPVAAHIDSLIGSIYIDDIYVVGFTSSVMLVTANGELIETLGQLHGVPAGMSAIGSRNNNIIVNVNGELKSTDINMATWLSTTTDAVDWSEQSQLPREQMDSIMNAYIGEGLPLERVILDIHSGRIIGTTGVILVDIAVILFLVLSISGWLAWYKKKQLQKLIDSENE